MTKKETSLPLSRAWHSSSTKALLNYIHAEAQTIKWLKHNRLELPNSFNVAGDTHFTIQRL